MDDKTQDNRKYCKSTSGRKARENDKSFLQQDKIFHTDSKGDTIIKRKRTVDRVNQKAFAIQSLNKMKKRISCAADRQTKKHTLATRTQESLEAPLFVSIMGCKKSGKSTLLRTFSRLYISSVKEFHGPVTIVTSKKQRVTFYECPSDLPNMINATKVSDTILYMINMCEGVPLEFLELADLVNTHGKLRVRLIFTHTDEYMKQNGKRFNKTKKEIIKKVQRIMQIETFTVNLLQKMRKNNMMEYKIDEVRNLARIITSKAPLPNEWRSKHAAVVVDRIETIKGDDANINKDFEKIKLYGYVRGSILSAENLNMHLDGVDDLVVSNVQPIEDPCPCLQQETNDDNIKLSVFKARKVYAPFCGLGGLIKDDDGIHVIGMEEGDENVDQNQLEQINNLTSLVDEDKSEEDDDAESEDDDYAESEDDEPAIKKQKYDDTNVLSVFQDMEQLGPNAKGISSVQYDLLNDNLDGFKKSDSDYDESDEDDNTSLPDEIVQSNDINDVEDNDDDDEESDLNEDSDNEQDVSDEQNNNSNDNIDTSDDEEIEELNDEDWHDMDENISDFKKKKLERFNRSKKEKKAEKRAEKLAKINEVKLKMNGENPSEYFEKYKQTNIEKEQRNKILKDELKDVTNSHKITGISPGRYVCLTVQNMPKSFYKNFKSDRLLVMGALSEPELKCKYHQATFKIHGFFDKFSVLKTQDPMYMSIGWRRIEVLPSFYEVTDDLKNKHLKYSSNKYRVCHVCFYAPAHAVGTPYVAFLNFLPDKSFRVFASGDVKGTSDAVDIVKKVKYVGKPLKVLGKTAFIGDMFPSEEWVNSFISTQLKTTAGVRGSVKAPVKHNNRFGFKEGSFRAGFEAPITMADIVFLVTWQNIIILDHCDVVNDLCRPDFPYLYSWNKYIKEQGLEYKAADPESAYPTEPIKRKEFVGKKLKLTEQEKKQLPFDERVKLGFLPSKPSDLIEEHKKKIDKLVENPIDKMRREFLAEVETSIKHKEQLKKQRREEHEQMKRNHKDYVKNAKEVKDKARKKAFHKRKQLKTGSKKSSSKK